MYTHTVTYMYMYRMKCCMCRIITTSRPWKQSLEIRQLYFPANYYHSQLTIILKSWPDRKGTYPSKTYTTISIGYRQREKSKNSLVYRTSSWKQWHTLTWGAACLARIASIVCRIHTRRLLNLIEDDDDWVNSSLLYWSETHSYGSGNKVMELNGGSINPVIYCRKSITVVNYYYNV